MNTKMDMAVTVANLVRQPKPIRRALLKDYLRTFSELAIDERTWTIWTMLRAIHRLPNEDMRKMMDTLTAILAKFPPEIRMKLMETTHVLQELMEEYCAHEHE